MGAVMGGVSTQPDVSSLPTLVLDCGSGLTRGKYYSIDDLGSVRIEEWITGDSKVQLPAIAEAIVAGPAAVSSFLDQLVAEINCSTIRPVAVVLGATGGLREAVDRGDITPAMLTEFEGALSQKAGLPEKVSFQVLSGEEEAKCEHRAVTYMAKKILPADVGDMNMISSGGMTTQLAYSMDSTHAVEVISLVTNTKLSSDVLLEKGVETGLALIDERLDHVITATGLIGQLDGTFAAIEMIGMLGEDAGIAHKIISKEHAINAIEQHLSSWKATYHNVDLSATGCSWRELAGGAVSILALRLLSLLRPSARLYFANYWQLTDSESLKPNWPLGLYLKSSCITSQ